VLAALPDIVRAAAEPMSHIESLTVMSADGASDLVRNATRAMIESTTAIKGLTGLDVPNLIGGALGRGFGERLRTGDGEAGSETGTAAARISEIAGAGLAALKTRGGEAAAKADVAAKDSAAGLQAGAEKVKGAAEKAGAAVETKAAAAAAKVAPADGNLAQWAKWLADQLRQVPDIQALGALRLSELADKAPAPVGVVWQTARAVLEKDYGKFTVAELLKRFG